LVDFVVRLLATIHMVVSFQFVGCNQVGVATVMKKSSTDSGVLRAASDDFDRNLTDSGESAVVEDAATARIRFVTVLQVIRTIGQSFEGLGVAAVGVQAQGSCISHVDLLQGFSSVCFVLTL